MIITLPIRCDPGVVLERGKEAGLDQGARLQWCHDRMGYHIIDYEVDADTGQATPIRIDGRRIEP